MQWGLALSGGALRGAAHVGVLSVLEENDLRPSYIAGTSAGSLVAALYALGVPAKRMEELLGGLSAKKLYDLNIGLGTLGNLLVNGVLGLLGLSEDKRLPLPTGLLKGDKLMNWIHELVGQRRFCDTRIPLAVMAADINSGEAVCYHSPGFRLSRARLSRKTDFRENVSIALALRASTAIPGLYPGGNRRAHGGGRRRRRLLPSSAAGHGRPAGPGGGPGVSGQQRKRLDNAAKIAAQAVDIMAREVTKFKGIKQADYCLNPGIYDVGLTDFAKIPECVERGRRAALAALPKILELIG